jgi:hypothetical protein
VGWVGRRGGCFVVLLRISVAESTVGRLLIGMKRFSRTTVWVAGQFSRLKTACVLIILNQCNKHSQDKEK